MNTLRYLKLAQEYPSLAKANFKESVTIALVTNFTDKILERFLIGLCLDNGIYPKIFSVPYKQYDFYLADQSSTLYGQKADITFIFFDASVYVHSPFTATDSNHFHELLNHIKNYAQACHQPVIFNTFLTPYFGPFGNLFGQHRVYAQIDSNNAAIKSVAQEVTNIYPYDTNRLLAYHGERAARDWRGLYAFDVPFSNDFLLAIAEEWFSFISHLKGNIKKCLVLDLDNTLWGGVVGEVGAEGIGLGPQYPGIAFQNFQRALLACRERGLLLAINSKNNPADVDEVFEKNKHMILKKEHFAAERINWKDKVDNIASIAEELNIGVSSLVFFDDDPLNRAMVRQSLPEVLVPEFSLPPEAYVQTLFAQPIFNSLRLTDEDKQKAAMYNQERQRKSVHITATSPEAYVAALQLSVRITCNNEAWVPRLSQLSLKTNQFNVTTERYSENQIRESMQAGRVYAAEVEDKFGAYGITIMAVVTLAKDNNATINAFLMSCRIMGRGIEYILLDYILRDLQKIGVHEVQAKFIPTAKNEPAKDFFAAAGFTSAARDKSGEVSYTMACSKYDSVPIKTNQSIKVLA